MNAPPASAIALSLLAAAAAVVWGPWPPSAPHRERSSAPPPAPAPSAGSARAAAPTPVWVATPPEPASSPMAAPPSLAMTAAGGLRVAAHGHLVVDHRTLSLIKELAEVSTPEALQEELQALRQTLPPQAAAQACDLVEKYYRFQQAFNDRTPANEVIATPEEAGHALDRLHALRVEFFGRELAQRWFGEDEAFGRELIKNQLAARR